MNSTPATNASDRDYFTHFRDVDDPAPYISAPVKSRVTGNWTVYLARRINGPDGVFLGVVMSALEVPYFEDFYQSVTRAKRGSVALLRGDGTVLARYPLCLSQITSGHIDDGVLARSAR